MGNVMVMLLGLETVRMSDNKLEILLVLQMEEMREMMKEFEMVFV